MEPGRHLHFPSALPWFTDLDEALAAARDSGRQVLLVATRPTCGGSRAMVEKTLNKEEILAYVAESYVTLAADADRPGERIAALLAGLPRREPTPVCVYLDAEGGVVSSTAGGRPPAVLLNDLQVARASRR